MKEKFIDKRFSAERLSTLEKMNAVIEEYQADGIDLTLRQLYYQGIAHDLFPESWRDKHTHSKNNMRSYKKLVDLLSGARLAGLVDWDAIVDRTRSDEGNNHWRGPAGIIESAVGWYGRNTRQTQEHYVEVWVEKDAMVSIVGSACEDLDVRYMSCRGFASLSVMYEASNRFIEQEDEGKMTRLLYLGDHDPSGLDMDRDIQDRLTTFGSDVEVIRVALTAEQIQEYSPPPSPAKITDSRYAAYVEQHGGDSWELDALDPRGVEIIIRDGVMQFTDEDKRQNIIDEQESERNQLRKVSARFDDIVADFLD